MTKNSFKLIEKDIDILKALYRFRVMTIDHLIRLTGRYQQHLNSRLLKLEARHYVNRKRNNPFEPYIYSVGYKSAPILAGLGMGDKKLIDAQAKRLRDMKPLFIPHALQITKTHLILELACESTSTDLFEWREGQQTYDSVVTRDGGKEEKLPVRPDAYFSLGYDTPKSRSRGHYFLEVDRGTSNHSTFAKKIRAYWNYYQQSLLKEKYNVSVRGFRVIITTRTEERAKNLCEVSKKVLPENSGNFYYFTPESNLSYEDPTNIFQDIFTSPLDYKTKERYSLIPPLATSKPNP